MALVGGSDVMRIVAPATPLAAALCIGTAAALSPRLDAATGVLLVASAAIWRPLHVLSGGDQDFLRLFAPQDVPQAVRAEIAADVLILAVPLGLWLLLVARAAQGRPPLVKRVTCRPSMVWTWLSMRGSSLTSATSRSEKVSAPTDHVP
jgi:hypothetical protein